MKKICGSNKNKSRQGSFRRPPLAAFGVDGAHSFADDTMGVRGTAMRPRRVRLAESGGAEGRQGGILIETSVYTKSFVHRFDTY